MEGRVLSGRYTLQEIVGIGGMSIVYKAWDTQTRRVVAVKILRPEFARDEDFVRRFTNEARAALQMHHPNIVDMYCLDQDGDTRFIVMEYVEGVTLKELIRQQGRIRPNRSVQMAIRILAAVDHAHRNCVIHRDIKPQNIMIDADYNVKVTDFGIARATNSDTITVGDSGNVMGSVHYFSPEQASGHIADEKSDLYSVGVVLYEMVTGQVPFDGDSAVTVALKHVQEIPAPPSSIEPEVTKALDEVIGRAMAKSAAERYQTASEMAADLKRAVRYPKGGFVKKRVPVEDESAPSTPRRRYLSVALLTLALVVLIVGSFQLGQRLYNVMYRHVAAPNIVGLTVEQAVEELRDQGIPYTIQTVESDTGMNGEIIRQEPLAEQPLYSGDHMVLYVRVGSLSLRVPDMKGMQLEEAISSIASAGFLAYRVDYSTEGPLDGAVLTQIPEPNEYVGPDTVLSITLSGETCEAPELVGLSLNDALILLEVSKLELGEITYAADSGVPDRVIAQSLPENGTVLRGTAIDLIVSRLDEATSYICQTELHVSSPEGGMTLRVTIEDEDGERRAYEEDLPEGESILPLKLLSRFPGAHTLRVYRDGEIVAEKDVEFR